MKKSQNSIERILPVYIAILLIFVLAATVSPYRRTGYQLKDSLIVLDNTVWAASVQHLKNIDILLLQPGQGEVRQFSIVRPTVIVFTDSDGKITKTIHFGGEK
ncbi:hypothetical protein KC644_00080 [Candidatus Berkelbacteria bacterium]|nr:hypothetical protein [Candidatus Berkelbacteria bacterium]